MKYCHLYYYFFEFHQIIDYIIHKLYLDLLFSSSGTESRAAARIRLPTEILSFFEMLENKYLFLLEKYIQILNIKIRLN